MDVDQASSDLGEIEKALGNLTLHSIDISRASNAVSILAEASRWDPLTRQRLADPRVLQELIEVIQCSINDALETVEVALRCIGNACIDNEAAKAEITKHGFSWAKQCLPTANQYPHMSMDAKIAMLTAKVLYNVCSDYEPAQQQCYREHIHYAIVQVCALDGVTDSEESTLFIELLFWLCNHVVPEQEKPPSKVLTTLLTLPDIYHERLEAEDFALLLETSMLFLREPAVRQDIIEQKLVGNIWRMLQYNEISLERLKQSEADRRLLRPLSTGLIWNLSDIAATPEFARVYQLGNEWIQNGIIREIQEADTTQTPRLVDAACQILGNLLWSTKYPLRFAHAYDIEPLHRPIVMILKTNQDAELLHSGAGLLIQMTRLSREVCETIGANEDTPGVVQRLCNHELPQLKQDGIALLRALGMASPANQERFADLARIVMSPFPTSDTAMVEA